MPPPKLKSRIEVLEAEIQELKKSIEAIKSTPQIALAGMMKQGAGAVSNAPMPNSLPTPVQPVYTPPATQPEAGITPLPAPPKEVRLGCMIIEPAVLQS